MKQPIVTCKWVCDKCGTERIVTPSSTQADSIMRELGFWDGSFNLPTGWRKVGDNIYCDSHSVQVQHSIIIDGEPMEILKDWPKA